VRDTGCGIDREEQALIFEEFKQAAAGRHQMSGAGLGLALSRHYARLMGGDLSVESTPGAGSLFTFRFKVQAAMGEPRFQQADTHRIAQLVGDTPPPRLLVVDDDEANRDMLMKLLELAGFDVRVANDGEDACSTARAWKPDAVLLDKRMPGQPCVETIRRLKDLPGETPPSVLLVTADVMQEPAEEMALYKADGFIAKPIQPDVLFSELQRLLKLTYTSRVERDPVAVIDPSVESSLARWLPGGVRGRMCDAIDRGDIAELKRHIDGCTSGFPLLARQLRYLADRFAYDRLLELLNERKENTHAST
jgi:CheY-like chemotaxis protein